MRKDEEEVEVVADVDVGEEEEKETTVKRGVFKNQPLKVKASA